MADIGVFEGFFKEVTGHPPYLYQARLAGAAWPRGIEAPTGTGKTAAVVLAWLWKRLKGSMREDHTPRRLAYALPMRSLTEQVHGDVTEWLRKAEKLTGRPMPRCHLLEGGEDEEPWYESPEAEAILIGTVDMLLSRALWRGYGQSRYMWPVSGGLLNNDTLWVFDEVQMLGSALETSAQLEGLRRRLGTGAPARSLWMSATPCWERLETADHEALRPDELFTLSQQELEELAPILSAPKTVDHADPADKTWLGDVAAVAVDTFRTASGPLLVIVNTVERARLLHRAISRVAAAQGTEPEILLLHSHFRPPDKKAMLDRLAFLARERIASICVSTQVVEAGVDVSAAAMIIENCPWPSLVQRLGRLNRGSEYGGEVTALVVRNLDSGPYPPEALETTWQTIQELRSGAWSDLPILAAEVATKPPVIALRYKDLEALFDTGLDLLGEIVDASIFIRSDADTDVLACWRKWEGSRPPEPSDSFPLPLRAELCPIPIGELRSFLRDRPAWSWEYHEDAWVQITERSLVPGTVVLLPASAGGYSPVRGWDPQSHEDVDPSTPLVAPTTEQGRRGLGKDNLGPLVSLRDHTAHVVGAARLLVEDLGLPEDLADAVVEAARWHDVGKAHAVFQHAAIVKESPSEPLAKAPQMRPYEVPGFRHEVASLMAYLASRGEQASNLVAYLIASHHGKVRLSYPPKAVRADGTVCGVRDGDELSGWALSDVPTVRQPLQTRVASPEVGYYGESLPWTDRALSVLAHHGPFVLSWIEAVLRAADWRASAAERRSDSGA